jgi:hypothetical protein
MKTHSSLSLLVLLALASACGPPNDPAINGHDSGGEITVPVATDDAAAGQSSANSADPTVAASIANFLRDHYLADQLEFMGDEQRRFKYDAEDLDGDGNPEYLVGFENSYFCGSGGCSYYLMTSSGEPIASFSVSRAPFIVLTTTHNGWPDLAVYSDGGLRLLEFDGSSYPSNPSVAPRFEQVPGENLRRLLRTDMPTPSFRF